MEHSPANPRPKRWLRRGEGKTETTIITRIPEQCRFHMPGEILPQNGQSVLLYECETWTITTKTRSRIQATEMRVLRLIQVHTQRDRIRNDTIRETLGVESILNLIEESQLRYFCYIKRRNPKNEMRRALQWQPDSVWPIGRPRNRWLDNIREVMAKERNNVCPDRGRGALPEP
ncbi:uncharacterized protein LOC143025677 [Oratosquilla oratoria]|uniref:uncharacterized protein LOC143025677 n=1 Tax=Oratosquilla oratoria TaxID=337810 RepID=UPI003F772D11